MDGNRLDWLLLHVDVPNLDGEVIARKNVSSIVRKSDIGYGRNDF